MAGDTSNPAYIHGHTGGGKFSPTYHSWACMLQRATNPLRSHAKHYVGRGITVCPEWLEFSRFLSDMGERPVGTTLERENNDEGYSASNCIWGTALEQANNTRGNRNVTLNGKTQSVTQWCRELGLSPNTVWARINQYGFTAEKALTAPKQDRVASAIHMTKVRVASTK